MKLKQILPAVVLGATLAGTVIGATPAQAGHFDNPGTTKVCTATGGPGFECVLTLEFSPGYFLGSGASLTVNLSQDTDGQYVSAVQTGGSCVLGPITVTGTTLTAPTTTPCQAGQTIVITEQLVGTGPGGGSVCQHPDITGNAPVIQVCAPDFEAPSSTPQTKEACKKGGWALYTNPSFKNQGDCVSFVATNGKNPPAG